MSEQESYTFSLPTLCVLSRSAYVSINIACVNTFDLRSPTGNPLKLAMLSVGVRRFCDWNEEKKSAPIDSGKAPVASGDARREGGHRRRAAVQERVRTCPIAS